MTKWIKTKLFLLDTAQFAIIQRRDTSFADVERNKAFVQ